MTSPLIYDKLVDNIIQFKEEDVDNFSKVLFCVDIKEGSIRIVPDKKFKRLLSKVRDISITNIIKSVYRETIADFIVRDDFNLPVTDLKLPKFKDYSIEVLDAYITVYNLKLYLEGRDTFGQQFLNNLRSPEVDKALKTHGIEFENIKIG